MTDLVQEVIEEVEADTSIDSLENSRAVFDRVINSYVGEGRLIPSMLTHLLEKGELEYRGLILSIPRDNKKITVKADYEARNRFYFITQDEIDIPISMFSSDIVSTLLNQVEFNIYSKEENRWVKYMGFNEEGRDFIFMLMILCRTSSLRADWESKLNTLSSRPHYKIRVKTSPKVNISGSVLLPDEYAHFIKEEHASKGFYAVDSTESGVCINRNDVVVSFEDPKKANARQSRLVDCPDSVCLGEHHRFLFLLMCLMS